MIHEYSPIPILEILISPELLVELLEILRLNNAEITESFDPKFEKDADTISVNKGALYIFVYHGTSEERKVSFHQNPAFWSSDLLIVTLNFVQKKGLWILENRVGKIIPPDVYPSHEILRY
ncbi:MAG: hypothetical protein ACFFDT_31810 [Candidatus Hodarchaeota archaeon]